jgi:type VI secretion system protein ImpE
MNSSEFFDDGQLAEAVDACAAELKKEPANTNRRLFFCELLCFQGDLQRADKQLETVARQESAQEIRAAVFRHLIRGEMLRQEVFTSGRVPGFLAEPTPVLSLQLRALVALREGDGPAAVEFLAEAEAARSHASGECDGVKFSDIRDVDDLTAPFLEVIMPSGEYFWLPFEMIVAAEFRAPRRPRDLIWRTAHFQLRDAPSVDGFVPTLYPGTTRCDDDLLRLGRSTEWTEGNGTPIVGQGLRMFLMDDRDTSIFEVSKISCDNHG